MTPKISIIMPTFNQSKFIQQAIDSIINQAFKDWELIIINDNSSDNTKEIIKQYYYQDARIRDYNKIKNEGTGSALNKGFEYAIGKYETWFSSDNILYPEALRIMYDFLEAHPDIDYVYCNCEIGIMDPSGLVQLQLKNIKDEISQDWNPVNLYEHYFLGIVWLWRRELREKAGPFQIEPCEDYDMVLRMWESGGRFCFLDKCLGWFRRHQGNMSYKIATSTDRIYYPEMVINKSKERRGLK